MLCGAWSHDGSLVQGLKNRRGGYREGEGAERTEIERAGFDMMVKEQNLLNGVVSDEFGYP